MLSLEEAIKHCEEVAEENEKKQVGFGVKKVIQTMRIVLNVPMNTDSLQSG